MVGLVSVTFRALPPEEIVSLAVSARLRCVEWGGDVHVPPSDLARARRVGALTRRAGLTVCSYGSYHRLCQGMDFAPVLSTAAALGAPNVRVWAGDRCPAEAPDGYFDRAAAELAALCDAAAGRGMSLSLEYHRQTLTETHEGALRLLALADRPNLSAYWQPNPTLSAPENAAALSALAPRLSALHVFHWAADGARLPLADGEADWNSYLRAAPPHRPLLLEFVRGDDPRQLLADAAALIRWEGTP